MMTLGTFAGSISYPWDGLPATEYISLLGKYSTSGNSSAYSSTPNIGTYTSGRIVLIRACVDFSDCTCTVGGQSAVRIASVGGNTHLFVYTGTLAGLQTITVTGSAGGNYAWINYYNINTKYQTLPISSSSQEVSSGIASASPSQGANNGILWIIGNQQTSASFALTNSTSTPITVVATATYNNDAFFCIEGFSIIPENTPSPIASTTNTSTKKQLIAAVFR